MLYDNCRSNSFSRVVLSPRDCSHQHHAHDRRTCVTVANSKGINETWYLTLILQSSALSQQILLHARHGGQGGGISSYMLHVHQRALLFHDVEWLLAAVGLVETIKFTRFPPDSTINTVDRIYMKTGSARQRFTIHACALRSSVKRRASREPLGLGKSLKAKFGFASRGHLMTARSEFLVY